MVEELGLSAAVIGLIMTWDHIIHLLLQPYVGSLSDRTRARFGCRKPFLMIGAPLAALFFVLVCFARSLIVPLALAILPTNLVIPVFRSPTIAYLGDLSGPEERSKTNTPSTCWEVWLAQSPSSVGEPSASSARPYPSTRLPP